MSSLSLYCLKNPFLKDVLALVRRLRPAVLPLVVFACVGLFALDVSAEDLFKGGKTTIKDTFGGSSTVVWVVYLLEILSAVYTYTKTKNLAIFGGIAAVMVFINVAFGIIPS